MQRFFSKISCSDILKITLKQQSELYHQMTRVLRMQRGDFCIFFEEGGDDIVYEITGIDKQAIELQQKEVRQKIESEHQKITLFQSIPNKLEKLEFILQKWVEVGVDQFVFFEAERSQKLPLLEKKKERLEQIVIEAVEQSWGNRIPEILYFKNTLSALRIAWELPDTTLVVAHTDWQGKLLRDIHVPKNIAIFVGPEGGFSPREVVEFQHQDVIFADFGRRILRSETAGMVSVFMLRQKYIMIPHE